MMFIFETHTWDLDSIILRGSWFWLIEFRGFVFQVLGFSFRGVKRSFGRVYASLQARFCRASLGLEPRAERMRFRGWRVRAVREDKAQTSRNPKPQTPGLPRVLENLQTCNILNLEPMSHATAAKGPPDGWGPGFGLGAT